eukprot:CAMPEP_0119338788 /NCGR_PEP_ID=MMETSP1333-20130426/96917_1 /TAXON_ID=418940 /ORGANISM="Scyphosphaera apsteinii, Strain RCC1455" /LENGTH=251 /DNA_ID=CAMNT_0007350179 /DNA_START=57 /DNA_END=812 /DNA_ORIENTATION=-
MTVVIWSLYGDPHLVGAPPPTGIEAAPRVLHVLGGHYGGVLCAVISTSLDLVVSGAIATGSATFGVSAMQRCAKNECSDSVVVSSAHKGRFVRRLAVKSSAHAVAISHTGSGVLVYSADDDIDGEVLLLFSTNGVPLARTQLHAPLSSLVFSRDGDLVVVAEERCISVRLVDAAAWRSAEAAPLQLVHRYQVHSNKPKQRVARVPQVVAVTLSDENHHTFVATDDGALLIYANPHVTIQVLERQLGQALNL